MAEILIAILVIGLNGAAIWGAYHFIEDVKKHKHHDKDDYPHNWWN